MKNKTKKVSSERIFNLKISYGFLALAVLLSFSTNYLSSYLYDLQKTMADKNLNALGALMLLLLAFYFIYKELKNLDK